MCEHASLLNKNDSNKVKKGFETLIDDYRDNTLSCTVIERGTTKPVTSASINIHAVGNYYKRLIDSTWVVSTDENGQFSFKMGTHLNVTLLCLKAGYKCIEVKDIVFGGGCEQQVAVRMEKL